VCDTRPELGAEVARQYDVPFYSQIDDLLDQAEAISLVTPTPLHFDMAMRCLAKGVHVLVEKPITETVDQAEQLTTAAEASGLVVQVGHIERFNPAYMELKSVLEDVQVLAINLRRLSAYEASNTDVDVILDLMIHDLDLVLDLVGREPTTVSAYGLTSYSTDAIDHAVAHLNFDSGPLLTLTASRVTEQKIRSIEVTARETYLECDLLNKNILAHRRTIGEYLNHNHRGVKYRHESIVERIQVPIFEPLFSELEHFVDCILAGKQPSVPARDGLRALRLAKSIQNEIREQLVKINGPNNLSSGQYNAAELVTGSNGHR
jgi:predicted dehydrogenase